MVAPAVNRLVNRGKPRGTRRIVASGLAFGVFGGLAAGLRGRTRTHHSDPASSRRPDRAFAGTLTKSVATAAPSAPRPVTTEELGQATWTLLHTLGAQFPEYPTRQQRRAARQLISSLQHVYPCHACAKHWQEVLAEFGPPNVRSGTELRAWLCEMHNVVNRTVGKPAFDCSGVEQRWGTTMPVLGAAAAGGKRAPSALCGGEGKENYCIIPGRK